MTLLKKIIRGNTAKRAVCILLAFATLVPIGCITPPVDYTRYTFRTVAIVFPPPASEVRQLKGVPSGKGDGALSGAGFATGSMWEGCGKAMALITDAGQKVRGDITNPDPVGMMVLLWDMGVLALCLGLTPVVGISGAISGAYEADPASEVERVKRSLQENLPGRTETLALFEKALYDPSQKEEGRAFLKGPEYSLSKSGPNADYRPLAAKGIDAVLEVSGFAVALSGKNLGSPLSLEACAAIALISAADNAVLFTDMRCRAAEARGLDAWSMDHWSLLKAEAVKGIQDLGQDLYNTVFRDAVSPGLPVVRPITRSQPLMPSE